MHQRQEGTNTSDAVLLNGRMATVPLFFAGVAALAGCGTAESVEAIDSRHAAGDSSRVESTSPYPPSPLIEGIQWAPPESIIQLAEGGDNWPITWAADGHLYTAYGDGWGFEPKLPDKLSLGLARVEGTPPDIRGVNIRSSTLEQYGPGRRGKKASGMLAVDGVLYLWARNADLSQLAWSLDHGESWEWADWTFETGFAAPTFLNFGKDYAGARDGFVYVYSFDAASAYDKADRMILARVPKERISERSAYEFFVRLNRNDAPVWSSDIHERGAVFSFPGRLYRSGVSYNPGLKRYNWYQVLPDEADQARFEGGLGIFDAPEPWGPWTTVFYTDRWDVGPGETGSIPPKWISGDGRTIHAVFSSGDFFSVRKGTLQLRAGP